MIDAFDIEHGSADPNASDDVDWQAVESMIGLAFKAREEQRRAEQNAMRFAGQQEYQSLVQSGASPEEALRRTAHKLYFNSPEHLTAALRYTQPAPSMGGVKPLYNPQTGELLGQVWTTSGGREQLIPARTANADRARESLEREMAREEYEKQAKLVEAAQKAVTTPGSGVFRSAAGSNAVNRAQAALDAAKERRYNLVGVTNATTSAKSPSKLSAEDIRAAFRAGKLSREDAIKQLKALGYD